MEKWRKTLEAYTFTGANGVLLGAFYGHDHSEHQELYGLELESVNGERLSSAHLNFTEDSLENEDLKNPQELLKYRAVIVEAEGLPEDTKKGLLRLLQKIEQEK